MTKTTRPKGDIFGKSKELIKKGTVSTKKWYIGTGRPAAEKAAKKAAKSYAKYGKPSVTLGKRILKWGVVKPAKMMLKKPGLTLLAYGAYKGAKHLGTKWGRGYGYSAVRQFDKKGKKII